MSTFTGLWLIMLLVVLITYGLQVKMYVSARTFTEDALASATLASAAIDIETFGISHQILIKDPEAAYGIWQEHLKNGMQLADDWTCPNKAMVSGPVEVVSFIVYNVKGKDVYEYGFGESTYEWLHTGGLGSVCSPDGKEIESTSVYAEITFPVKGAFGITVQAHKSQLVDVVSDLPYQPVAAPAASY